MSIITKLHIEDKALNVLKFRLAFNQSANNNGYPSSKATGGIWDLAFETQKDDLFLNKFVSKEMINYLKIVITPAQLDTKSKTIELRDVYVVEHQNNFDGVNKDPMKTYVKLSPASMVQNGVTIFKKYWKITDPDAINTAATTISEAPTPSVISIDWIHPETKETIEETSYKDNIALTAQIENPEGDTAQITIVKEDGTEFENGETELTFEETITEDGVVELTALEIKEQWETFKTAEVDKLIAKVNHNGYQKKSGKLKIAPTSKVLVNFRTGNSYKGEYGFDWLRMSDTGKKGDTFYKDIIGSYSTGSFVQNDAEYFKLGKKFEMPNHPIKANDKYVVPVLTLLPNKKATLTLKVEIEGANAKKIEYKYDNTFFKLSKQEVSHKTIGKKELADDLIIECISEFSSDQFIEVKADGKFAGKIKIIANDKGNRYKADIVFVEVETAIAGPLSNNEGRSTGKQKEFTKYFNQLLANGSYSTTQLDLSKDITFNTKYAPSGSLVDADTDAFQDYLNAALKNSVATDYSKHFKIYLINEEQGGLYGRAYDIPAPILSRSVIVLRPGLADSTLAHETFHAMGLHHSFSDSGKFTFEQFKTDNIMDYSDIGPDLIPVISTWQWQWQTIQSNIDRE